VPVGDTDEVVLSERKGKGLERKEERRKRKKERKKRLEEGWKVKAGK